MTDDQMVVSAWPVAGDRRQPRRGRHPIFRWLRFGFVVVLSLCFLGLLGVMLVAGKWPGLGGAAYLALIDINVVLLVLLSLYIIRRLVLMLLDRRGKLRGWRLHYKVLAIFVFLAVIPAIGVGGTAIFLLNQGIESWFASRVSVALEGGRQVAEGYLQESRSSLMSDVVAMSRDPMWQLPPLLLGRNILEGWLRTQLATKRLDELYLADSDGQVLASGTGFLPVGGNYLPQDVMTYMQETMQAAAQPGAASKSRLAMPQAVGQVFEQNGGQSLSAIMPLKGGLWLVAERRLNAGMLARIGEIAAAYNSYVELSVERHHIKTIMTLSLLVMLAGTLAGAVWTGIRLANKVVQPVTMLVHGTNRVSAGDLTVRLEPRDDDELGVLTQAFNRMTLQLANNRDLLERKNHELDERRRFMEAVLTGVTAGVVAVDAMGIVRVANQSAQTMLKLGVGTQLDKSVPELADVIKTVADGMKDVSQHGRGSVAQREVKVTLAEGDTRTLLVRLVMLGDKNSHVHHDDIRRGVVLTFDDVTPLIRAQRLAAWQDVARRLAHEIKNPLTPIQLSAERLKRRYLAKLPDEDKDLFRQLTDTIVQQSEEMRRMTNEFSDFARMPQARLEPENILNVLDDVVVLQRSRGGEGHLKVEYATHYGVPKATVLMDKGQMIRVFTNLLENAYNAIAEREGTNLPQGEVQIVVQKTQPGIVGVEIQDNGRGLPDTVEVDTLFDPYVTTRKGGTGLGLAIVKKVMDEHGGTVRLLRRKGGGTTVELAFPVNETEAEAAQA
jgi:two-component system nitrogen regulation sensor histidine kinase NtrY